MNNSKSYISLIQQIIQKTGWPQSRLAEEVGVSFATVNRWLNGHTKPHPGQLRRIEQVFKAVVGIAPVPLEDIAGLFKKIAAQRKRFPDIGKCLRDQRIVEEFLLELTYHSDAIEGSTLTKRQTEAVLFDKAVIKDKGLIEHLEAANHAVILREIFQGGFSGPVMEEMIKSIHKALMQGIREDAGMYARFHRGIRGVDLVLPAPQDIPEEMAVLCQRINRGRGHPIEHIAQMHADFEAVHPFSDGNGRVGRLLMIVQLIQQGFAPCLITVERKAQYYESLEYAQKKSPTHLARFVAEAVLGGYEVVRKYA